MSPILMTFLALSTLGANPKYEPAPLTPAALATGFVSPPASARPWCYWYWFNMSRLNKVHEWLTFPPAR
jgi:hypothetical protein